MLYFVPIDMIDKNIIIKLVNQMNSDFSNITVLQRKPFNLKSYNPEYIEDILNYFPESSDKYLFFTSADAMPKSSVLGLSTFNGNTGIISTHKLLRIDMMHGLRTVTLHELGHMHGLTHCCMNGCIMNTSSVNALDNSNFCMVCKAELKRNSKNWIL